MLPTAIEAYDRVTAVELGVRPSTVIIVILAARCVITHVPAWNGVSVAWTRIGRCAVLVRIPPAGP
jgi:hypothetical protein